MPEFYLDTGDTARHQFYDALPAFAQGYLEAALFCGVTYLIPDEKGETLICDGTRAFQVEIDGLGLGQLTPDALAGMVGDAIRFHLDNTDALARATESGEYDMDQAGRDFWFTRQGHGVGFWDRDLGDVGDELTDAAQGEGEAGLYCEPVDPDNLDVDDPDAWTLAMEWEAKPATPEQWAKVAPGGDALPVVGGRYGAPMGRRARMQGGALVDPENGQSVTLQRVTLDPGGYDAGGAYWGLGATLWRLVTDSGATVDYTRADTRQAAVEAFQAEFAGLVIQ